MDSVSQINRPPMSNLEAFEDQNVTAAVCRSVPNGLNTLNSEIANCTTTHEQDRNFNFAENTFRLQRDIDSLTSTAMDSLLMGDSMFGKFGYVDITKQVKDRNTDLVKKKEKLVNQVEKNEAIIERSNRDFNDVRDTVPEPQPKRTLRFIEDYTLAILVISYLFMIVAVISVITFTAEVKAPAFGKSVLGAVILSAFLFGLLYMLA